MEKKQADNKKAPMDRRILAAAAFLVVVVGGGIGGIAYFAAESGRVYTDKSQITAPTVDISPIAGGTLRTTFVTEGQIIPPNTVVAQVGVELIKSIDGGLVVKARTDLGTTIRPGEAVVSMINPAQLKVVGRVEEDKGLTSIKAGDRAKFSVDAYPGKTYDGVVTEVAPISNSGDVVFTISDKRQVQEFDVKVAYDEAAHPELKNGMSAKLYIYKTR